MMKHLFSISLIVILLVACDKPSPLDGTRIKISPRIHLELNHNSVTGNLNIITIEPKSRQSIPIDQYSIDLQIFTTVITTEPIQITLDSVTNSYFNVQADELVGIYEFRGWIEQLQIHEQTYRQIRFIHPEVRWWETTRARDKRLRQELKRQLSQERL